MAEFEFTLVVAGLDPNDEGIEDRLYEAGCDDALVSVIKATVVLDFTREAKNFAHALASAISDVRRAGARVVRVEPDNYVNVSDIAERAGLTRQAVSLLVQGKRGPGNFPAPAVRVSTDSPLWDWHAVARWLLRAKKLRDREAVVQAAVTREANIVLEAAEGSASARRVLQRVLAADARPELRRRLTRAS